VERVVLFKNQLLLKNGNYFLISFIADKSNGQISRQLYKAVRYFLSFGVMESTLARFVLHLLTQSLATSRFGLQTECCLNVRSGCMDRSELPLHT
jgi:hypothetical protein